MGTRCAYNVNIYSHPFELGVHICKYIHTHVWTPGGYIRDWESCWLFFCSQKFLFLLENTMYCLCIMMRLFTIDGCGDYRQVWCVAFFSKTSILVVSFGLHQWIQLVDRISIYLAQLAFCSDCREVLDGWRSAGLDGGWLGLGEHSARPYRPLIHEPIKARAQHEEHELSLVRCDWFKIVVAPVTTTTCLRLPAFPGYHQLTSHKLAQSTLGQSIHEGLEDASHTSDASMHLCQHCPCRVQGAAHSTTLLSFKTWTQCVREKVCARNHSYTVNREHITFADIIQHSTLTSRVHVTQTLQYTVNLTTDKIQSMILIKVQPIPLGVSFSKAQSSKLEHLFRHVSVKRDVRALSFELWNSIRKYHPKWDRLYIFQSSKYYYDIYFYHLTYSNIHSNKLLLWQKSCK